MPGCPDLSLATSALAKPSPFHACPSAPCPFPPHRPLIRDCPRPQSKQIKWLILRFQAASFLPWSDVRRIPLVHVDGMAINITEALTSSGGGGCGCGRGDSGKQRNGASVRNSGRRSGISGASAKGSMESTNGDGSGVSKLSSFDSAGNIGGGGSRGGGGDGGGVIVGGHTGGGYDKSQSGDQAGTRQNNRRRSSGDMLAVNWREDGHVASGAKEDRVNQEDDDSWTHMGRRASLPRGSPTENGGGEGGGGRWGDDGYQLERMAQATLESMLGHEFAAKYKVMVLSTWGWVGLVWSAPPA